MSFRLRKEERELERYAITKFPGDSNKFCFFKEGKFGRANPVLIVKTPSTIHLVHYTLDSISDYTLSGTFESDADLENLKRDIWDGSIGMITSNYLLEDSKIVDNQPIKNGCFLMFNDSLILVSDDKFLLVKRPFDTINHSTLFEIMDNSKALKFKEINIKEYYGFEVKIFKYPFLLKKMDNLMSAAQRYINYKFEKLENFIGKKKNKVKKWHYHNYYQSTEKLKRYLITITEESYWFFRNKYYVHFTFKSLRKIHSFVVGSGNTKRDAENIRDSIPEDLSTNKFQSNHRNSIEKFENFKVDELKSFKFRIGDCLIRWGGCYYHHGIYTGCPNNCPRSKQCRSCNNVFHASGEGGNNNISSGSNRSGSIANSSNTPEKASYVCLKLNEFFEGYKKIKIKRNEFQFLTIKQYHKRVNEIILAYHIKKNNENEVIDPRLLQDYEEFILYYTKIRGFSVPYSIENFHEKVKINLEKAYYNLLRNNCGHTANKFENESGGMGKHNGWIAVVGGGIIATIALGIFYAIASGSSGNTQSIEAEKKDSQTNQN